MAVCESPPTQAGYVAQWYFRGQSHLWHLRCLEGLLGIAEFAQKGT